MAALTREQFAYIVGQRAIGITPSAIVAGFIRDFKPATCTLDDVALAERSNLPPDWQKFFDAELAKFLDAPTANRAYRVALLNEKILAERARGAKFEHLVEQVAKEMADAYAPKGTPGKMDVPAPGEKPIDSSITWKIVDPVGDV